MRCLRFEIIAFNCILIYLYGFIDLNAHVWLLYFVFVEFILQIYDYWKQITIKKI